MRKSWPNPNSYIRKLTTAVLSLTTLLTQNFQVSSCFINMGEVNKQCQLNSYAGQLDHILKYEVFRDINSIANIPFSLVDQISNSHVDNDSLS